MDAKTAVKIIKQYRHELPAADAIASLLESLASDAEHGQMANNLCCDTFKFDYRDDDCMDCGMRSYCRLRAGKGGEQGEV